MGPGHRPGQSRTSGGDLNRVMPPAWSLSPPGVTTNSTTSAWCRFAITISPFSARRWASGISSGALGTGDHVRSGLRPRLILGLVAIVIHDASNILTKSLGRSFDNLHQRGRTLKRSNLMPLLVRLLGSPLNLGLPADLGCQPSCAICCV